MSQTVVLHYSIFKWCYQVWVSEPLLLVSLQPLQFTAQQFVRAVNVVWIQEGIQYTIQITTTWSHPKVRYHVSLRNHKRRLQKQHSWLHMEEIKQSIKLSPG